MRQVKGLQIWTFVSVIAVGSTVLTLIATGKPAESTVGCDFEHGLRLFIRRGRLRLRRAAGTWILQTGFLQWIRGIHCCQAVAVVSTCRGGSCASGYLAVAPGVGNRRQQRERAPARQGEDLPVLGRLGGFGSAHLHNARLHRTDCTHTGIQTATPTGDG